MFRKKTFNKSRHASQREDFSVARQAQAEADRELERARAEVGDYGETGFS